MNQLWIKYKNLVLQYVLVRFFAQLALQQKK